MIKSIERFAEERKIDKLSPNDDDFAANILEEVLEHRGYNITPETRNTLKDKFNSFVANLEEDGVITFGAVKGIEDKIDAIADIVVFSITEMMKFNYRPTCVLREVSKEVNSRKGKIVNGKFEKFKPGEEGYVEPYKANYKRCEV
jgi:hypothetical protein